MDTERMEEGNWVNNYTNGIVDGMEARVRQGKLGKKF